MTPPLRILFCEPRIPNNTGATMRLAAAGYSNGEIAAALHLAALGRGARAAPGGGQRATGGDRDRSEGQGDQ